MHRSPFYLLGSEDLEEEELPLIDSPVKIDKLAIEIEAAIQPVNQYWKPLRKSSVKTVQRETPKVGRNDPCPCGSGKKFKQCCEGVETDEE